MRERSGSNTVRFIPDAFSPRFLRFFGWWCREKMLRKKFFAVRVARETASVLRERAHHDGPVIVLTNHVSWWDPLVMLVLHRLELCDRGVYRGLRAPMDADQLDRFRFFRRLGAFGIDPDDPASLDAMAAHVKRYFETDPAPALWINPQGRFADVREPIEVRPGAAKMAASDDRTAAVCVQLEYTFWLDCKPELLIRYEPVEPGQRTTTGWLRAMRSAMRANAGRLAELAAARDPEPFTNLIGGAGANVHPLYGFLLKLRGKDGAIDDRRDRVLQKAAQKRANKSAAAT